MNYLLTALLHISDTFEQVADDTGIDVSLILKAIDTPEYLTNKEKAIVDTGVNSYVNIELDGTSEGDNINLVAAQIQDDTPPTNDSMALTAFHRAVACGAVELNQLYYLAELSGNVSDGQIEALWKSFMPNDETGEPNLSPAAVLDAYFADGRVIARKDSAFWDYVRDEFDDDSPSLD